MSSVKFYKSEEQVPMEMHKVRVVQKLYLLPVEERLKRIKEAGGQIGCPADAIKEIRDFSDFVAEGGGGNGAVREFIQHILSMRDKG